MFDTGAGALALAADIVDGAAVDWPKDDAPANLAELLCVLSALEPLLRDIEDMTAWRLDPQGFAPAAAGAQARLQLRNPSGELLHDLWFAVEDALIDALPLSPEMEMLGGMVAVSLWLEGPLAPLGELGRLGPGDVVPVEAEAVIGVLEGPGGRRLPGVLAARGWRFAAQPFEPYGPSVAPGSAAVRLAIRAGPVLIERARWAGIAAGEAMRLPAEVARSAILLNGADILAEGRLSAIGGLFGFFVDRLGPGK
jgi:hypothetical protein